MKNRIVVLVSIAVAILAGLLIVAFLYDPLPDDAHLQLPDLPPPLEGNPLEPGSKFMTLPPVLPDGVALHDVRTYEVIRRTVEDPELAQSIVSLNAELLDVIDQALEIDTWQHQGNGTNLHRRFRDLGRLKQLQSIVSDGETHRGVLHDLEAAELFKHLMDAPQNMFGFMIATGSQNAITQKNLAGRLQAIDARAALVAVLDKLNKLRSTKTEWQEMLKAEYKHNSVHLRKAPSAGAKALVQNDIRARLIRPNRTLARYVDLYDQLSEPLPASRMSGFSFPEPVPYSSNYGGEALVSMSADVLRLLLESWTHNHARNEAFIALTCVKLHMIDHGALPASLEDLVPDYLDAVPTDAYDGKELRYDAGKGWIYSVGNDFLDGEGDATDGAFLSKPEPTLFIESPE